MTNGSTRRKIKASVSRFSSKLTWKKLPATTATGGDEARASAASPVPSGASRIPETAPIVDENVLAQATSDAHKEFKSKHDLGERAENMLESGDQAIDTVNSAVELFDPLLEKVQWFVKLVDALADIHPYAQIAVKVFLGGVKVVIAQYKRDQAMGILLQTMDDVYLYVTRAKDIKDMDKNRKRLLRKLSLQTVQCAYFIREHAKIKSFVHRVVANTFSGDELDAKINEFTEAFTNIQRCFTQSSVVEINIQLVKVLDITSDIQTTVDLLNLACIGGAGLDSNKGCLPGTRVDILDELSSWVNAEDDPRVFFLFGGAGTGKSSIAHSIGARFRDLERLGSFFRFDRSSQQDRPLRNVVRTIAQDLANWDPVFRNALATAIHDTRDLAGTVDMSRQWEELLIAPLRKMKFVGPVLVVIDAFDECAPIEAAERRLLLKLLTEGVEELPSNFRILITSRSEKDVFSVVSCSRPGRDYIKHIDLGEYKDEAREDIARYLRHELTPIDPDSDTPLDDNDIQLLADKAEGLFQWAATICRAIREQNGMSLREGLNWCLGLMLGGGASSLDDLYRGILKTLFNSGNERVMTRFRVVMAQVLCCSSPLGIETLEEIHRLANGGDGNEVTLIVKAMGSLLSGIQTRTSPIRPHHTSFRDFLIDSSRSHEWFVNLVALGHPAMVRGCLRVMNTRLTINMCGLETSSVFNRDVPNLNDRISKAIPPILSYATCNWQKHLPEATLPPDLVADLDGFLREKLLFWLELLSLLEALNRAAPALEAALANYPDATGASCKELLHDAILFIRHFAVMIALSATHVYLSALPFSPRSSLVRATYLVRFPNLPVVDGIADYWPQTLAVLSGHTSSVLSVAYSPDGQRIASGSYDATVRIWDVETGATCLLLKCASYVGGVAFSPDGHRLAACSANKVHVWDCANGETVCELEQEAIWCLAYSQGGDRIASGGEDGRICVWSMATQMAVRQLIHGDRLVSSVAFSTSGRYLASGGEDAIVRVWGTDDGQPVGAPFKGHTDAVRSVLFSRDDRWIISGSQDATIRIWELSTHQTVHTISHPGWVLSLSISPDGSRVVSGSSNRQMLVWDLATQESVGEPFRAYNSGANAVSFSPDGRHIVSGMDDQTVRIWSAETAAVAAPPNASSRVTSFACSSDGRCIISGDEEGSIQAWDATTGRSIHQPLQAHSNAISCVRFSPDGSRFVTASGDHTLRVWDWETLQPLGEPLHGHTAWVMDVDFSPDGRRIVSSSFDKTLRIWDVHTLECLLEPLVGHTDWVRCVSWSPEGTRIASGSNDQNVRVWDADTGRSVAEPFEGHDGLVRSVSWSPDGRYLMTSSYDGTVRFWDVHNRKPAGEPLECHQGRVLCSRYSPDGLRIASGGANGSMRLWDAQTRVPVGNSLSYPGGGIDNLAFSLDGRRIISRTWSDVVIVWDVDAFTEHPEGAHPSFKNLADVIATPPYNEGPPEVVWDGWVRDANGSMVMWVPDEYRNSVWWQGMVMVLGRKPLTIDFTDAFYGSEWTKCYNSVT